MQAVAELGYVPNPHARSLRDGKTNMVALLIPDIANPFYSDLVLTAQAALEAAGLDTMIFNSDVPGGHPRNTAASTCAASAPCAWTGLIATDFSLHGMHEALLQVDVPAVFIGRLPNRAVDNVRADDFGGGYLMGATSPAAGIAALPTSPAPRSSARRCSAPRASSADSPSTGRLPIRRCASRAHTSHPRASRRSTGCSSGMWIGFPRRSSSPTT